MACCWRRAQVWGNTRVTLTVALLVSSPAPLLFPCSRPLAHTCPLFIRPLSLPPRSVRCSCGRWPTTMAPLLTPPSSQLPLATFLFCLGSCAAAVVAGQPQRPVPHLHQQPIVCRSPPVLHPGLHGGRNLRDGAPMVGGAADEAGQGWAELLPLAHQPLAAQEQAGEGQCPAMGEIAKPPWFRHASPVLCA